MSKSVATRVIVDRTHMRRRATGIERITQELFSPEALAPLNVTGLDGSDHRLGMMFKQMVAAPVAGLGDPRAIWVFPGYPPSPLFGLLRNRAVLYVHDLFLITRPDDLNWPARLYMAPLFRRALKSLRLFFVNSLTTAGELQPYIAADAQVVPYRPRVRNVFGLHPGAADRPLSGPLRVGSIGTVEPRKNLLAAANLCSELAMVLGRPVELHVIGRRGWGNDYDVLSREPNVRLHGFLGDERMQSVVKSFDLFLSTSHDEGLGLPLLEAQYGGLAVVAPDKPVFREVLAESGVFIDPEQPAAGAQTVARIFERESWRSHAAASARVNIDRWNGQADDDRARAVAFLAELGARTDGSRAA